MSESIKLCILQQERIEVEFKSLHYHHHKCMRKQTVINY